MPGVTAQELSASYPVLYHMAELGSWPMIRNHGLLSTSALLDLFEISGQARYRIEAEHRPASIPLSNVRLGQAVVRDQIPLSDEGLRRCLRDGLSPSQWHRILNSKVFFWVSNERLDRMLAAKAYRDQPHTVLTIDTGLLLADYYETVALSPINSGCTKPYPHPRGLDTFLPPGRYPFEAWKKKRGLSEAVVELAVERGVHNVERYVIEVREQITGKPGSVLWKR